MTTRRPALEPINRLVIKWRLRALEPSIESPDSELTLQRCADELEALLGQADPVAPPDDLLVKYVEAEDPRERDVLFLKLYAAKVLNGTAISWEIPSVVANTLTRIAGRFSKADPVAPWQQEAIEQLEQAITLILAHNYSETALEAATLIRAVIRGLPLPSPPVSA